MPETPPGPTAAFHRTHRGGERNSTGDTAGPAHPDEARSCGPEYRDHRCILARDQHQQAAGLTESTNQAIPSLRRLEGGFAAHSLASREHEERAVAGYGSGNLVESNAIAE